MRSSLVYLLPLLPFLMVEKVWGYFVPGGYFCNTYHYHSDDHYSDVFTDTEPSVIKVSLKGNRGEAFGTGLYIVIILSGLAFIACFVLASYIVCAADITTPYHSTDPTVITDTDYKKSNESEGSEEDGNLYFGGEDFGQCQGYVIGTVVTFFIIQILLLVCLLYVCLCYFPKCDFELHCCNGFVIFKNST
ncbi:unnamed protein product [Allacma fusca]|uniref:Uncharacterized protein n=1 Tax=Allacma fusca TaxID=39272 RepID=A0A8J2K3J7_9HEXA|nr:unnamed protein product [Allacma fusca]